MTRPVARTACPARATACYNGPVRISLVALDLDDTLLDPDLGINRLNLAAVKRALAVGVPVVLASGRTIASMAPYAAELGMQGRGLPMICVNGAEVRDLDSGGTLRRIALSPEDIREALTVLSDLGLPAQVYEDELIIATEWNEWTQEDSRLTGLANRVAERLDEMHAVPRGKLIAAGPPDHIGRVVDEARSRLARFAHVVVSKPYFMEILPHGADKGEALSWVAARFGVPREEVMAVGDSGNDIGMLRWAGLGCAPADARADVLAIAAVVSPLAHHEGAVAELLERFVLAPQ